MKRRSFLAASAAAPLMPMPAQVGSQPSMKITDIKAFLVHTEPVSDNQPRGRNWVVVKVETDQGIHGIGEAYSCGPDEATVKVIEDYRSWLVGQDPRNIEHIWSLLYNFTRFPGGSVVNSAISGIDHALWDIAGKAVGLPVYMLLGGKVRERIRLYQSIGGGTPKEAGESAKRLIAKYGYTAVKMSPHMRGTNKRPYNYVTRMAGERVGAVRDAIGPDVDIGVDIHAKFFEVHRAVELARAIEPYNPMWLEEPIRPENTDTMKKLADRVNIPLASGECNYTKHEFREILDAQCLDIVQPDICCCGGITEMKKIAHMAEAACVMVAPHNPMGPIATTVNVHFAASTPNFKVLEYRPDDTPPRSEVLKEPLMVEDGYITVPNKPGLGIEFNEEVAKKYPAAPWRRGFDFREDGSVAFI